MGISFRRSLTALGLALAFLTVPMEADAQRRGDVWIGGELGDPSGIVVRPSYDNERRVYEFLAAWDLDKFFFLNVHRLQEKHLNDERTLHFFYGPGAFVGIESNPDDEAVVGISGRVGLGYGLENWRVYVAVTPRLSLVPDTDGQIGGALGVQFKL
jgi:hypothetical protein